MTAKERLSLRLAAVAARQEVERIEREHYRARRLAGEALGVANRALRDAGLSDIASEILGELGRDRAAAALEGQ